jgi:LysM repeat protein
MLRASSMPPRSQTTSARLLAPLALAACAVAVLVVIASSSGGGESSSSDTVPDTTEQTSGPTTAREPREPAANYTVEPGDTLGGIAEETGVAVETLQELNPELDPQALIAGQKIKLRE